MTMTNERTQGLTRATTLRLKSLKTLTGAEGPQGTHALKVACFGIKGLATLSP